VGLMIEAVVFDKDGVLINSDEEKYNAIKRALVHFGHDNIDGLREWYFGRVGMPGIETSEYCVRHFGLDGLDPMELYNKTEEIRRDMLDTEPAPIIESSVAFLRSLVGKVKIGVASSDFPRNIEKHMEQAGVLEYIDAITSGERNSGDVTHDKPHPEVYLVAADRLGISPERCVAIEDTALGVQAAKSAGMYVVGFKNQSSGDQDLHGAGADRVVDDLSKLDVDKLLAL